MPCARWPSVRSFSRPQFTVLPRTSHGHASRFASRHLALCRHPRSFSRFDFNGVLPMPLLRIRFSHASLYGIASTGAGCCFISTQVVSLARWPGLFVGCLISERRAMSSAASTLSATRSPAGAVSNWPPVICALPLFLTHISVPPILPIRLSTKPQSPCRTSPSNVSPALVIAVIQQSAIVIPLYSLLGLTGGLLHSCQDSASVRPLLVLSIQRCQTSSARPAGAFGNASLICALPLSTIDFTSVSSSSPKPHEAESKSALGFRYCRHP